MSGAGLPGSGRSGGSGRLDPTGRSRRGSGWAQLGRRSDSADDLVSQPTVELRAVPVRSTEPPAEEHHLGDRLSAFVDGELGHDARERVQAHLATCAECLAEADEGRAVKQLLTHTGTPAPSGTLMARLLAVATLPEDEQGSGPGGGALPATTGTLGGSRLTGGSFGRGPGASFGGGALGAGSPLPGVDPRAGTPTSGFFGGRRGSGPGTGLPSAPRPLAASADSESSLLGSALLGTPLVRPTSARGRRFVFAAAGAFSVAAVTLGGVGSLSALSSEQPGHPVTPAVRGPGGSGVVPMTAELPVDFPVYPVRGSNGAGTGAGAVPAAPQPAVTPNGLNHQLLR